MSKRKDSQDVCSLNVSADCGKRSFVRKEKTGRNHPELFQFMEVDDKRMNYYLYSGSISKERRNES